MILQLRRVHFVLGVVRRVLIEVGQEDGLRIRRFNMFARTPVAVAACADFVVEGAVDLFVKISLFSCAQEKYICMGFGSTNLVLFCAEDGGEIVGHDEGGEIRKRWVGEGFGRGLGGV